MCLAISVGATPSLRRLIKGETLNLLEAGHGEMRDNYFVVSAKRRGEKRRSLVK